MFVKDIIVLEKGRQQTLPSVQYWFFKGINRLEIYSSDLRKATLTKSVQFARLSPKSAIC
jgi:hypothetical protein